MQSVVYRSHAQELLPANSDVNKEETVLPANQNVNKLPPIPTKNISYKRPIPLDGSVRINAIIKLTLTSHVRKMLLFLAVIVIFFMAANR